MTSNPPLFTVVYPSYKTPKESKAFDKNSTVWEVIPAPRNNGGCRLQPHIWDRLEERKYRGRTYGYGSKLGTSCGTSTFCSHQDLAGIYGCSSPPNMVCHSSWTCLNHPHHPHVTNPDNCTGHHRAVRLWPVAGAAFLQRRRLIVGICAPGRLGTRQGVGERTQEMVSSAWVKTK